MPHELPHFRYPIPCETLQRAKEASEEARGEYLDDAKAGEQAARDAGLEVIEDYCLQRDGLVAAHSRKMRQAHEMMTQIMADYALVGSTSYAGIIATNAREVMEGLFSRLGYLLDMDEDESELYPADVMEAATDHLDAMRAFRATMMCCRQWMELVEGPKHQRERIAIVQRGKSMHMALDYAREAYGAAMSWNKDSKWNSDRRGTAHVLARECEILAGFPIEVG
jgi:hypothetical protein